MRSRPNESRGPRIVLPGFDVTEGAWPCEDPGCWMCQLDPEDREEAMAELLLTGWVIIMGSDGYPHFYSLKHVTMGKGIGVESMLKLTKQDAKEAAQRGETIHPHVASAKPR